MKKISLLLVLIIIITTLPAISVFAAHDPYVGIKAPEYDEAANTPSNFGSDARGFIRNLRGSAYAVFKNVNFGENGAGSLEVVAGTGAGSEGILAVYIDSINSQPIAELQTIDGAWTTTYTLKADIKTELKGVHDVYVKNLTGVCNIYTLLFYEKPELGSGVIYKSEDHFEDISESDYNNEINMFYEMGILNAFNDTDYEPKLYMNRGDFATVMYRLLGIGDVGNVPFADVSADNPNSQAISWMYGAGIITGDGNSLYRPYDFITLQEAATIAVRALGFEKLAQEYGGYPSGYMTIASREDLFDGITADKFLRREEIARFLYNFVHADYLDIESIGDNSVEYVRKNGIMETSKGIYVGNGLVTATGSSALKIVDSGVNSNSVMIDDVIYNVGDTAAAGLLGYQVDFYYRQVGNKKVLTNIRPDPTLKVTKISSDSAFVNSVSESGIEYYDESGKLRKIRANSNTAFIYNGKAADKPLSKLLAPGDFVGRITHIDNEDTDVVIIEQHETIIVGSVDTVNQIVYNKLDPSKKYSFNSKDTDSAIYLGGEPYPFGQIKEGSVFSLFQSGNDTGKKSNVAFIEQNFVLGSISSISGDTVTINGTEYQYDMADGTVIELGLSGTFYLNYLGMLVAYDGANAQTDIKSGVILDYEAVNNGFSSECALKVFTSGNNIETFTFSQRVDADGVSVDSADKILSGYGKFSGLNNLEKTTLIRYKLNSSGKVSMIDTYMSGAGGESDKLCRLSDDVLYRLNKNTHSFLSSASGEKGKTLFVYDDSPETFIFSSGQSDEEKLSYKADMMALIGGDASVTGDVYTISDPDDKIVDYFVWNNRAASHTELYDSPFVFERISTFLDDDEEEGYIVTGHSSVSKVEYKFTNDFLSKNDEIRDIVTALRPGDVARFKIDYEGNIMEAEIIYLRDGVPSINGRNAQLNDDSQINDFNSVYQKARAVVGEIVSVKNNVVIIDCVVNGVTTQEMLFIDNVKLNTYNSTQRNPVTCELPLSNLVVGDKVLICINEKVTSLVLRYEN